MGDTENARARKEALEASSSARSGANRQRLWAAMTRYLAAEAEHAHHAADRADEDRATATADRPGTDDDPGDDPA